MGDETSSEPLSPTSTENAMHYHDEDLDILNLESVQRDSIGFEKEASYNFHNEPVDDDEVLEELSPDGVLDERTIELALSNLGKTADGSSYAYLTLKVPGIKLEDVSILCDYEFLQHVDLSHNQLKDLSALSHMPNLVDLNVSHNQLNTMLDFAPPKNLKSVDLSYNQISEIPDLSAHQALSRLILDHNQITKIEGLEQNRQLRFLSLEHNQITRIENLVRLPLQRLSIMYNKISAIENIETLVHLQEIVLAGNRIRSLKGLENHPVLESVDLEDNEVIDIEELKYIKDLRLLRSLNLLQNPIQEFFDYRLAVIFELPSLTKLDLNKVDIYEKVSAKNRYDPPPIVCAQRDHRLNVVYSFFQPHSVLDSTLQSADTPYPMLVLVGPQGSGKRGLALKLVQEFPDFFGYGISHTTRAPYPNEENGREYHFVSTEEFEALHLKGKFVQTCLVQDHLYGLSLDAMEAVAREGLACVVHMELEGVLSLKMTYHEPRYVLTMPLNKFAQESHLREKGVYNETQINNALRRAARYVQVNQQHPGFFDMVVNTDDYVEAYFRLRRLVMDYLGLSSIEESVSPTRPVESTTHQRAGEAAEKGVVRTWSKTSGPTSATQGQLVALGTPASKRRPAQRGSSIVSGRGAVEEASLRRRRSAAREIISGYRSSGGAPAMVTMATGTQMDGVEPPPDEQPAANRPTSGTTDSAAKRSDSPLSELRGTSPVREQGVGPLDGDPIAAADAVLDRLDFLSSGGDSLQRSLGLAGPRPDSGSRVLLPPIETPPVAMPEY